MKRNKKQHTILKGEGANQHTLYGNINVADDHTHFSEVTVNEDSRLRHEEPNGKFAEHNTLKVERGNWSMGRQVEYNPFKQTVSTIWD
jgi:hypothetical protein